MIKLYGRYLHGRQDQSADTYILLVPEACSRFLITNQPEQPRLDNYYSKNYAYSEQDRRYTADTNSVIMSGIISPLSSSALVAILHLGRLQGSLGLTRSPCGPVSIFETYNSLSCRSITLHSNNFERQKCLLNPITRPSTFRTSDSGISCSPEKFRSQRTRVRASSSMYLDSC